MNTKPKVTDKKAYREYDNVHKWLNAHHNKKGICELCGTTTSKVYQWALKHGCHYEKKIENFMELCVSCHMSYDFTEHKRQTISKRRKNKPTYVKKVAYYDPTHKMVGVCGSIKEACKKFKTSPSAISNSLYGRSQSAAGIIFYLI